MAGDDDVLVELTYTLDDFRILYRWVLLHYARGTAAGYVALAAAAVTLAVVASIELAAGARPAFPVVALCSAAAVTLYLVTLARAYAVRTPRRIFAYMRERAPIVARLDERAVTVRSTFGTAEHLWAAFTRRADLASLDVLFISQMSYVVIPKRDVPPANRAAFDRLIARVPLRTTFK